MQGFLLVRPQDLQLSERFVLARVVRSRPDYLDGRWQSCAHREFELCADLVGLLVPVGVLGVDAHERVRHLVRPRLEEDAFVEFVKRERFVQRLRLRPIFSSSFFRQFLPQRIWHLLGKPGLGVPDMRHEDLALHLEILLRGGVNELSVLGLDVHIHLREEGARGDCDFRLFVRHDRIRGFAIHHSHNLLAFRDNKRLRESLSDLLDLLLVLELLLCRDRLAAKAVDRVGNGTVAKGFERVPLRFERAG
mmetsp:Transcript_39628/g.93650  ORF Transcript_39628/g.93650 Transcript_39628/m.93650 type:complete len:249 (+) Transcript_39628:281-1027(+)